MRRRVAVVVSSGALGERLASEVLAVELGRRLPDVDVEVRSGADGQGPPDGADPVAVVVDSRSADAGPVAAAWRSAGSAVFSLEDPAGERRVPWVTLLADRLHPAATTTARVDALRLAGVLPAAGSYVLAFLGAPPGAAVEALAVVAAQRHHALVVGGADAGPGRLDTTVLLDVVAAVSSASAVIADDPAVAALGVALGTPTVGLVGDGGAAAAGPWPAGAVVVDEVRRVGPALAPARTRAADGAERQPARDRLDAGLDALAVRVRDAAAAASPDVTPEVLAGRVAVLEATNRGLQRRLQAERRAFGATAAHLLRPEPSDDRWRLWVRSVKAADAEARATARCAEAVTESIRLSGSVQTLGAALARQDAELATLRAAAAELAEVHPRLQRAEAELASLRSSRLYRALRPLARAAAVVRAVRSA